jgi:ribokinase
VGADGRFLLETLETAEVDTSGVRMLTDAASGQAVIQVNDAGENAIVIDGGANRRITSGDVDAAIARLASDDWLLLQNEINDLPRVFERLSACPAKVAFNLAPVDGREQDYDLNGVDLLIVNEIEARALVTADSAAGDDEQVARTLAHQFPAMNVVLTSGSGGLVYASGEQLVRLPAHQVDAVDETAAGDAFIGYLLAGLLAGGSMLDALRSGSAAGALAVTMPGAASSIPLENDVRALLEKERLEFSQL